MSDYKDRVRQERDELAARAEKLKVFLMQNPDIDALDLALLHRQHEAMAEYIDVLDQRIARF